MVTTEHGSLVPGMIEDTRVQVFRRIFTAPGEYDAMQVDAYVVLTERYAIICDTLLCPEDMQALLQSIEAERKGRQILVIDSHADWDHAWGNNYFTGVHAAPIIAHEECLKRLQSDESRIELADYKKRYPTFEHVVLTPPTITFQHTLTIHGGDLSFELIHAPGHHLDQIAAWIPEIRLLLAFDAAEMPLPLIENAQTVQAMMTTLQGFLDLQPQYVLCSHGMTTSPLTIEKNLAYLREIEQRGRQLLTHSQPTTSDLEHASELIHYPLDAILVDVSEPVDRTFYGWAHDNNVRCVLQWLIANV